MSNVFAYIYISGGRITGTKYGNRLSVEAEIKRDNLSAVILDEAISGNPSDYFVSSIGEIRSKTKLQTLNYPDVVLVGNDIVISGFPPNTRITWPSGLRETTPEEEISVTVNEPGIFTFIIDHQYYFPETITVNTDPAYVEPPEESGINIEDINATGTANELSYLRGDGTWAVVDTSGGSWGDLTGTLSDQTDLQNALDLKADTASLGTAASQNSTAFATAAQGNTADTAVQPGDLGSIASLNLNLSETQYLRGDGSWIIPPNDDTTYSVGNGLTSSGTEFSLGAPSTITTDTTNSTTASSHTHALTLPTTATRWPTWSEVTTKPTTFTPSNHNHNWSDINGTYSVEPLSFTDITDGIMILCPAGAGANNNAIGRLHVQRSSGARTATMVDFIYSAAASNSNYTAYVEYNSFDTDSNWSLVQFTYEGSDWIGLRRTGDVYWQSSAWFNGENRYYGANRFTWVNTTSVSGLTTLSTNVNKNVSGDITAQNFSGNGSGLTSLDAANLSSGVVPNERLPNIPFFSAVDLDNKESTSYSVDGRLYWDLSAGVYIKSSNANHANPALLWSSANFTAGNGLSVSYGGEDEPTLSLNASAADVGAAPASHTHSYLPLSGGTLTGNLTVSGSTLTCPGGVGLVNVTGNYGNIQVNGGGTTGGWDGYSINGRAVFMHNNSTTAGLYDDVNNDWMFKAIFNSSTYMYHNGSEKIRTTSGGVTVTGSGTASDWIATSDIRLKDNIAPLNVNDCLNQINQLVPSSFTWKESGEEDTGLIAQQVQEVLPERVKGDDQLAVSYAKITTQLIGAVQALTTRVQELEEQLNVK